MTIPSLGLCEQPWLGNGTFGWETSMTVYRRKATIIASRASWNLLDVQDLSTPSLQDIGPDDLFTILDLILSPTQNSTVNQNSSSYDLSNYLFQFLHLSSKPNAQISKPSLSTSVTPSPSPTAPQSLAPKPICQPKISYWAQMQSAPRVQCLVYG
jgi:hypothetical protein